MQYFLLLISCIVQLLKFVKFWTRTKSLFLYMEANSKYRCLMECFMTTFYVYRFEKADMNSLFSCDVTCFRGSDDKIYDVQGTWLKWLFSYIYTFSCCIAPINQSFLESISLKEINQQSSFNVRNKKLIWDLK